MVSVIMLETPTNDVIVGFELGTRTHHWRYFGERIHCGEIGGKRYGMRKWREEWRLLPSAAWMQATYRVVRGAIAKCDDAPTPTTFNSLMKNEDNAYQ